MKYWSGDISGGVPNQPAGGAASGPGSAGATGCPSGQFCGGGPKEGCCAGSMSGPSVTTFMYGLDSGTRIGCAHPSGVVANPTTTATNAASAARPMADRDTGRPRRWRTFRAAN